MEKVVEAATALLQAYRSGKRIEFYGVVTSGVVAQDAQHKFFRLGINTMAYSDGHFQVMSATMLGPDDGHRYHRQLVAAGQCGQHPPCSRPFRAV